MKYAGNNSPEYWNSSWDRGVKKFPIHTMNWINRFIPNNISVLDIGCGDGTFLERLKNEKGCQAYGIDISNIAISKVNEKGIPSIVASAEDLDNFGRESCFDVVVCSHLLEHIENDDGLVKNIARLTKQFAIIAVPNDCSYPEHTGEHVRKYTKESLIKLLVEHFRIIEDKTRYNRTTLKNHLIFKCLK